MSLRLRYDTTLPVIVPPGFSREKAIEAVKCDRPCFLDKFPEAELPPGPREIHLIYPTEMRSLGEILRAINSEGTMQPEPLDMAFVLADQHPGYGIEKGIAFLASLWSEGKSVSTTFFPYLSSGNGRHALHLRSNQRELHPGWRIAVSSPQLASDSKTEAEQMDVATGWIRPWQRKPVAA